ncbi:MAG: transketolase [bacterium]
MTKRLNVDAKLAELAVNTIRMLAVDAVEKAQSGHPGMPMGAADYAFVLWSQYLRFNPEDPKWPNRDRFVLSAGHGSMLLYSLLHLAGFDLPLDELKNFRQWESRTPGHPEYWCAPGVETTTGPLGQGFGNGVGMALASKMMAARFNTDDFQPITHRVYGIVSDGDIMEGISHEAASLAGHLKLGNLIYIYDDNKITIEGSTNLTFSENVGKRFEAYGWQVIRIDGHNHDEISGAIEEGQRENTRPTLIIARTHIAKGSPGKQDSAESHGAPLGAEEVKATKENLGWPQEPTFIIPDKVKDLFAERVAELKGEYDEWQRGFEEWSKRHPDLAEKWRAHVDGTIPEGIEEELLKEVPDKPAATRATSGRVLQRAAQLVPSLCGGSADLEPSTKTAITSSPSVSPGSFEGRNLHFGIREHAMGAILNGMALYGGFIPYGATFLVFSDYMRPPIRLAAMMGIRVIYVFTHDSIFVGEDGPTHQPVEQLAALRAIPNLTVIRPADGVETAISWALALKNEGGPTALILTRQNVPPIPRGKDFSYKLVERGGYVLSDASGGRPDVTVIATGSEVAPALEAKGILEKEGIGVRVVSMPSAEIFSRQPSEYRESVLPPDCPRFAAVEAGSPSSWYRFVGRRGLVIGMERFGASAPYKVLAEKFGFTGEAIAKRISEWLN